MSRVRDLADNNIVFVDGITTADISEGANLFFTNTRADARVDLKMIDEDTMSSNSAVHMPSQQSVKAYIDAQTLVLIDEDNMATNSATRPPSQQSVKAFVDTSVAGIVDSAPGTLDTLNELASALGDDANFSTTVTSSIATKLPLSGGAMTGAITTNSTFDGVDIAARDAVLTSTTTVANAALPKAGGALTGNLSTTGQIDINTASNGLPTLKFSHTNASADNFQIGGGIPGTSNSGFSIRDVDASANRLVINSSGNVGIGIAAPLAKLNIAGDTSTFDGMAKIYLTDSNSQAASRNWSIGNGGSGTGNLTFAVSAAKDGNAGNNTAVNAMVINSSGNVGIGTASPAYKLDVYGTDDITMRIHRPSSGLALTDTCGIGFSHRGDTNTSTTDTRAAIVSTYNGSLHLCTEPGGNLNSNPVDHAALSIIGTTQNVGIGTTPESTIKLDVSSGAITTPARFRFADDNNGASNNILAHEYMAGIEIENTYSGAAPSANGTKIARLTLTTVTAGGYGAGATIHTEATSNGYDSGELVLSTGSNSASRYTERMRIGRTGNVGIGTTTPGALLDLETPGNTVDGTYYSTATINNTGSNTYSGIRFDRSAVAKWRVGIMPNDTFQIAKLYNGVSDDAFIINSSGNVGIDNASPTAPLHVGTEYIGRPFIDVLGHWKASDDRGDTQAAGDGGGMSYTHTGSVVKMTNAVGSHSRSLGQIRLTPGKYYIVLTGRPTNQTHGWTVFGTNSNGFSILITQNSTYSSGYGTNYISAYLDQTDKDQTYAFSKRSAIMTVTVTTTYGLIAQVQPYGAGGYQMYVTDAKIMKLS